MPEKGVYETHEVDELRSYESHRVEEVEKELAESEAVLAQVPRLRETYFQAISALREATNRLYAV